MSIIIYIILFLFLIITMYLIYNKFIKTTSLSPNKTTSSTSNQTTSLSPNQATSLSSNQTTLLSSNKAISLSPNQTTSPTSSILSTSSSTNKLQVNVLQNAFTSTDVKQININENFTNGNTIIFDTNEVINQNFNLFLNTYFPTIDVVRINDSLIKTHKMTMQEIINKKIEIEPTFNSLSLIKETNDGYKNYLAYVLDLSDPTLFILCGLYVLVVKKLTGNPYSCNYYFNDYEKEKDFIIYTGPCLSNDAMKIKYDELKDTISSDWNSWANDKIYKKSLRKEFKRTFAKDSTYYNFSLYTTSSTITLFTIFEDKIINVFNKLYDNFYTPKLSTMTRRIDSISIN